MTGEQLDTPRLALATVMGPRVVARQHQDAHAANTITRAPRENGAEE